MKHIFSKENMFNFGVTALAVVAGLVLWRYVGKYLPKPASASTTTTV